MAGRPERDVPPEPELTPELVLQAYASGIFPMAEAGHDPEIFWVDPHHRGIIPLDGLHLSRSLRRRLRAGPFELSADRDFAGVVEGCADRSETWINAPIRDLYQALHAAGYAHSLEVWEAGRLVGGIYGVSLGAAFFGESMFSRRPDASKVALTYLVDRLRSGGFRLFDTQFITDHLASMGAIEVTRRDYHRRLAQALAASARFDAHAPFPEPQEIVQRITQTS